MFEGLGRHTASDPLHTLNTNASDLPQVPTDGYLLWKRVYWCD